MENTYQTYYRFKLSLTNFFNVFFNIFLSSAKMKILRILLQGNSFMLKCNENMLVNRVAKIFPLVLLKGYLITEIENIFRVSIEL